MTRRRRLALVALTALLGVPLVAALLGAVLLRSPGAAEWGAAAIVRPARRAVTQSPTPPFETLSFTSEGERLEGWLLRGGDEGRGLVVYLHGIADNRQSGLGAGRRLVARGYDFFTFDGRAHGRSSGQACTYGYRERHDVGRALDALGVERAILLGHSLGAAVALQAAALDRRVVAVVAASAFCDLPTIVHERARWLRLPEAYVDAALRRAGELADFPPEAASPLALAAGVEAPVLLLHGADDWKTGPHHSRRLAAALRGPRRLVILPGVGHDEILGREEAWREIDAFLDGLARGQTSGASGAARPAQRAR